uniref:Uncharacterized protein n=1 Tax=Pyricularia oryzae (strain P131) TaxID=1143193 RepID=L7IQQ8_PYRO1
MSTNWPMPNWIFRYVMVSPFHDTNPSATVVLRIAIPYALRSYIHPIGDDRPCVVGRTINRITFSCARLSMPTHCSFASSASNPCASNRSISSSSSYLIWLANNIRVIFITAEYLGV